MNNSRGREVRYNLAFVVCVCVGRSEKKKGAAEGKQVKTSVIETVQSAE